MKKRIVLAAVASAVALASVVGVALGIGHDEPRLVRTAGVSAPLEESPSSTSVPAAGETAKVAELDATVENHEARIGALESTTTTAPAAQSVPTTVPTVPVGEAEPTTTTTIVEPTTTTQPPTTTTTFRGPPWWCPVEVEHGYQMQPCDSTTTTSSPAS